jgi:hypothetical protein
VFWLALLTAGVLFAMASLTPRWIRCVELADHYRANQEQLVRLQDELRNWELLSRQLEAQPDFGRSFGSTSGPNGWVLPVDQPLRFRGHVPAPAEANATGMPHPLWLRLSLQLAGTSMRRSLLCVASAVLLVWAFGRSVGMRREGDPIGS